VNVRRVRIAHRRDSKLAYFWRYGVFLLYAFLFLAARNLRRRYRLVHVHNMPDVLVFSTLVPKLMGARVILDLHDPMPELMMTIYGLGPSHTFVRVLRLLERWSIGFADLAITPNVAFRDLFVSRSCGPDKMHIVMNSPEEAVFRPDREPWRDSEPVAGPKPFRIMHHGTLVHRHGIDVAVEAVALASRRIPVITLTICGSRTPYLDSVLKLCKEKGLDDCVKFLGFKSQDEIAQFVAASDLGIVPNRRSPFTEINMPTRIFEYLAMGKPVIAPDTRGIRDYFDERNLIFFQPDNPNDLADKIFWVYEHRNEAVEIVRKGQAIYRGHLWAAERLRFVQMVAGLV
jgi:glycosyltransferase involved in cell wall biosynthesis